MNIVVNIDVEIATDDEETAMAVAHEIATVVERSWGDNQGYPPRYRKVEDLALRWVILMCVGIAIIVCATCELDDQLKSPDSERYW